MPFSLLKPLLEIPIAALDVETTGASAGLGHRVVEIGLVRLERGVVVSRYEKLFDPGRPIDAGASALTGITNAMVKGQARFAEALEAMLPLLAGAALLGHNVGFDLSFIHKEFRRAGRDLTATLGKAPVLDTVRMARRRFGRGGNSLGVLSRRLGIEPATSHRALADAETTAALLGVLLGATGGWSMLLCDVLSAQGGVIDLAGCAGTDLLPLELEEAMELRRPVMMEYIDARGVSTTRMIDPLQVRRGRGELVLIAFCHLRQERRNFKVERIVHLTRVDEKVDGSHLQMA